MRAILMLMSVLSRAIKLQVAGQYKGGIAHACQTLTRRVQAFTADRLAPRIIRARGIAAREASM